MPRTTSRTLRQTPASYVNAVFAILLGMIPAYYFWKRDGIIFKTFAIFFFLYGLLQTMGLIVECMGHNDIQNPWTGEWSTLQSGNPNVKLRHIRPDMVNRNNQRRQRN